MGLSNEEMRAAIANGNSVRLAPRRREGGGRTSGAIVTRAEDLPARTTNELRGITGAVSAPEAQRLLDENARLQRELERALASQGSRDAGGSPSSQEGSSESQEPARAPGGASVEPVPEGPTDASRGAAGAIIPETAPEAEQADQASGVEEAGKGRRGRFGRG